MIKINDCKQLNPYDHYIALEFLENKAVKLFCKKNKINNNSTCKFLLDNKHFVILHKSSKKTNTYQVSYFDEKGAYADKEFNSLFEAVKYIYIGNKLIQVL